MPIVFNNPQNTNDGILDAFRAGKSDVRAQAAFDQEIAQGKQSMALVQQRMALERQQAAMDAQKFDWLKTDRAQREADAAAFAQQGVAQMPQDFTKGAAISGGMNAAGAALGGPLGAAMGAAGNQFKSRDIELDALRETLSNWKGSEAGKAALVQDFTTNRKNEIVDQAILKSTDMIAESIRRMGADPEIPDNLKQGWINLGNAYQEASKPGMDPHLRAQLLDGLNEQRKALSDTTTHEVQKTRELKEAVSLYQTLQAQVPMGSDAAQKLGELWGRYAAGDITSASFLRMAPLVNLKDMVPVDFGDGSGPHMLDASAAARYHANMAETQRRAAIDNARVQDAQARTDILRSGLELKKSGKAYTSLDREKLIQGAMGKMSDVALINGWDAARLRKEAESMVDDSMGEASVVKTPQPTEPTKSNFVPPPSDKELYDSLSPEEKAIYEQASGVK